MARTMAGGSAAAKAQELRDKAARLEAEAKQWDKGAEGERRTAAILSGLAAAGYVVLDDLAIPGSKANIDHVVIGPSGVVVVETKAYTGRLQLSDGTLWHGRFPLRRELSAAQFEADKVREVVASTGWSVKVRSVMCVHGVDVPADPTGALAPLELCGPLTLQSVITSTPPHLSQVHVQHLAGLIEAALPPQRIASPTPPTAHPLPVRSGPAGGLVIPLPTGRRRRRARRHSTPSPIRHFFASVARAAIALVAVLFAAALAIAIATATIEAIGEQYVPTTTTTSTAPPPAPAGP